MKSQYVIFMLMPCTLFFIVSVVLIPVAWVVGVQDKMRSQSLETKEKLKFMILGLFILLADFGADLYYFWLNNFRSDLNKIIIL
mmetsp:Transcript_12344/g.19178  ORF Transcript_12344/g.19178 Transcript_12344/m.19178 type:complete len:84 (-) Transcript_12344:1093-1344(-)